MSRNNLHYSVGVLLSGGEQFSPYFGGAVARWTYEVYSRAPEHVEVTVFGFPTAQGDLYPMNFQSSSAWVIFKILSKIPKLRRYSALAWLKALSKWFNRLDIIHIQNRPRWVSILRNLGYRGIIVLHMHNPHLGRESAEFLDTLAQDVDFVAVCSKFLGDQFIPKSRTIEKKAGVIYNGVNTDLFCPREKLRQSNMILFVGQVYPGKGLIPLIKAYEKLLIKHRKVELVIVGGASFGSTQDSPFMCEIKEMARKIETNRGGHIVFPGYVHHDKELPAFFQSASILACPSIVEDSMPLVNVEAMACATPVVGSRRGGIPEVLGETGLTVRHDDVEGLVEAFSLMFSNSEYRKELGNAARKRVMQLFDWEVIAKNWISVLSSLVKK